MILDELKDLELQVILNSEDLDYSQRNGEKEKMKWSEYDEPWIDFLGGGLSRSLSFS
jgi:hypothetical protein